MNCVICHSNEISLKEVKEDIVIGDDIVYVLIRIPVCGQCGERYYDRRSLQFLEDIESRLRSEKLALKEIGKVLLYE